MPWRVTRLALYWPGMAARMRRIQRKFWSGDNIIDRTLSDDTGPRIASSRSGNNSTYYSIL
ncbi:MAG: hypothetical protein NVS1B6_13570 [Steroidobacteraceae bacterium]